MPYALFWLSLVEVSLKNHIVCTEFPLPDGGVFIDDKTVTVGVAVAPDLHVGADHVDLFGLL